MPDVETKTPQFVLQNKDNGRYLLQRGWTTKKQYARRFSKVTAEAEQRIAAYADTNLTIEPAGEENGKE